MRHLRTGALLAGAVLLLSGCSALVDQDQVNVQHGAEVILEPGHTVGQTFVARHGGLSGVEIWLEHDQGGQGEIRLNLCTDPQAREEVATALLPLEQVESPGFYRLSFPPLRDSHGRYYYAFLDTQSEGGVRVGAGPARGYLDGALYHDHEPLDAQIAFRLIYDPRLTLLDVILAALRGTGLVAAAALLFVVPGSALMVWLWPNRKLSRAEGFGIAIGLSLALYPLLLLWTGLFGLHLGPLYAWIPAGIGLVALIWHHRAWRPEKGLSVLGEWLRSESLWPDLALLALFVFILGVRLMVVRTLDAPMWGDSYQHTMITQLLVDNGGLFESWEPYAELQTFTYHFGFHASTAALHWLTGMKTSQAVLWGAQILNAMAVLVLYPLTVRVSGSRWAGVGAVLIAGLLSPMPMYYVNWGRYTQLAGQTILPAAVLITLSARETPRRNWSLIALSWISVGGLALTHYRVLIFYIVFILSWLLIEMRQATWRRTLARVASAGIGSAMLFLPWLARILGGAMALGFARRLTTDPGQLSTFAQQYNAIRDLSFYLAPYLWLALVVAVGVGLWRNRRGILLISLWWFLLLVATNPSWLHLPGSGIISNHALFMAVYIPAGILLGYLLGQLVDQLGARRWYSVLSLILVVVIALVGTRSRMRDLLVSRHALITRPDIRAIDWIRENTARDSRFWTNSFFAYGGGVIVGSDGGWWLPLLAERANTVPPLSYGTEQGPYPEYREWVNDLTRQLQNQGIDDQGMLALLEERGITHVYIGQQQGRVNYNGSAVLEPEALLLSEHYQLVYHQDRVWVFEVLMGSVE